MKNNMSEIDKLVAISNKQEFQLISSESPLVDLDRDSELHDYDFTSPINVFEINDKEVKKLVANFFQGVQSLFNQGGKRPIDGVNDYGNYTYNSIVLNDETKRKVQIKQKTDEMRVIPRIFDEMRTTGKMLQEAGVELGNTIANYMSSKYNTRIAITFDNLHFTESYFYSAKDISKPFDKEEYEQHIDDIYLESKTSGLEMAEPTIIISDTNNLVDIVITDSYTDGVEQETPAKIDILTGEINNYSPNIKEGSDILSLKTQYLTYDNKIKINVFGEDNSLFAPTIQIFNNIIMRREEELNQKRLDYLKKERTLARKNNHPNRP